MFQSRGVKIDSDDDVGLTNTVRRHFLEHFGHRSVAGVAADYAKDAIIVIQVVNGEERIKVRGQEAIGRYFCDEIFALHPAGQNRAFTCSPYYGQGDRHAVAEWSAKTPSVVITPKASRIRSSSTRQRTRLSSNSFLVGRMGVKIRERLGLCVTI